MTSSSATFVRVYEFLEGEKPEVKYVVPQDPRHIRVAGRARVPAERRDRRRHAQRVPRPTPRPGSVSENPVYTKALDAGGFGPFKVDGHKHEFAVTTLMPYTIHNYPEPFERSDYFYRVLDAPALRPFIDRSDDHTTLTVTRMREFWGDQTDPVGNDSLKLNGLEVINPAIAPRARRVLAVFNFDKNSDHVTDTSAALSPFNAVSFLTGVDDYMPASADHSGKITVREVMRGGKEHVEKINVPNWSSTADTVSVFFRDYVAKKYKAPKKGSGK